MNRFFCTLQIFFSHSSVLTWIPSKESRYTYTWYDNKYSLITEKYIVNTFPCMHKCCLFSSMLSFHTPQWETCPQQPVILQCLWQPAAHLWCSSWAGERKSALHSSTACYESELCWPGAWGTILLSSHQLPGLVLLWETKSSDRGTLFKWTQSLENITEKTWFLSCLYDGHKGWLM